MCSQPLNEKPTPLRWEDLVVLSPHQRKLKLLAAMASSEGALKRFWEKVDKRGPNDCWNWRVSTNTDGYGQFAFYPEKGARKANLQAHQIAFFLVKGTIPDGLCVCHTCDNRKCNNAAHLFLGTHQVNIRDRDQKGRHVAFRGSENTTAKLVEEQVQQIRIHWFVHHTRVEELAAAFGVSDSCIKGIVYGANWRHLLLPDAIVESF